MAANIILFRKLAVIAVKNGTGPASHRGSPVKSGFRQRRLRRQLVRQDTDACSLIGQGGTDGRKAILEHHATAYCRV